MLVGYYYVISRIYVHLGGKYYILNTICTGESFLNSVIIILKDISSITYTLTSLQALSLVQQMGVLTVLLKQICNT